MIDDLVEASVDLPSGPVRLLQPRESAELPDVGGIEWAPIAPYWSVLWRSGVSLARELDGEAPDGLRVVELGCGLGVPSIAAARAGAAVLATDECEEALSLLRRNARRNGAEIETAVVDWTKPADLLERAPFDLVVAADVLYEPTSAGALLSLMPRLAPDGLLADPGRPAASEFLVEAERRWRVETRARRVVQIHRLRFAAMRR